MRGRAKRWEVTLPRFFYVDITDLSQPEQVLSYEMCPQCRRFVCLSVCSDVAVSVCVSVCSDVAVSVCLSVCGAVRRCVDVSNRAQLPIPGPCWFDK